MWITAVVDRLKMIVKLMVVVVDIIERQCARINLTKHSKRSTGRLVVRNTLVTDVKLAARTFVRAWTEFSCAVRRGRMMMMIIRMMIAI